jgi:hypothetical protein
LLKILIMISTVSKIKLCVSIVSNDMYQKAKM